MNTENIKKDCDLWQGRYWKVNNDIEFICCTCKEGYRVHADWMVTQRQIQPKI